LRVEGVEEDICAQEGRDKKGAKKTEYRGAADLYSAPNIIWVITSRRMRWAGHVARVGRE